MKKYNIAVVGATGMVGRTFLKVLEEVNLPAESYTLYASARSAGSKLPFMGTEYEVKELNENSLYINKLCLVYDQNKIDPVSVLIKASFNESEIIIENKTVTR